MAKRPKIYHKPGWKEEPGDSDGWFQVETPFNQKWITNVKETVPKKYRRWVPRVKRWEFTYLYLGYIRQLSLNTFYASALEEVRIPTQVERLSESLQGTMDELLPALTRKVQVEYIDPDDLTQLRGDS